MTVCHYCAVSVANTMPEGSTHGRKPICRVRGRKCRVRCRVILVHSTLAVSIVFVVVVVRRRRHRRRRRRRLRRSSVVVVRRCRVRRRRHRRRRGHFGRRGRP